MLTVAAVMAQDVSVRDDHPQQYVVVEGDTLWDIAGRFLDEPWQWPAIWKANPEIENPHLIYPGDVFSLVYIDGRPVIQLARDGVPADTSGKETVKLSPQVRRIDRGDPINAVPLDAIEPFLRDIRVISPSEFEGLPYIVANEEARITATFTDVTFARGLNARVGDEFIVARLVNIYDEVGEPPETQTRRVLPKTHWKQVPNVTNHNESIWTTTHPWNKRPKNPIGYEMWEVSRVRVQRPGEVSVLDILRDRTEVRPGDFILPVNEYAFDSAFLPQALEPMPDDMVVLATTGAKFGVGHYQIVTIRGGSNQGVMPGHLFSAFGPGEVVDDRTGYRWGSFEPESQVRLPSLYNGMVMVFRTFGEVSYAIVMDGPRLVKEFDELQHPKNRG
jgi:hypothetical protein